MRGIKLDDLPERYRNQARAQLANHPTRRVDAQPERDEQSPLVKKALTSQGMVHSDRPLIVRITRVNGRHLDDDNLSGGCKELRDAIAAAFGRKGDSAKEGFSWEYMQESKNYY